MQNNYLNKVIDRSASFKNISGIIWVVIALSIGIFVRAYFLSQPMRYDESYTFLQFVNKDIMSLFYYPLPNNHVLHSILTKISTSIWGASPVSIRLVAFLAGTLSIIFIYRLSRALGQSGIFAAFSFAVFPYLILYSTSARGYILLILLSLALALTGISIMKQSSIQKVFLFSLLGALGMLTMPSMLFPLAGIYLWIFSLLMINGNPLKITLYRFAVPTIFITGLLTVLFYIPVIIASNGIQSIIANRFVKSQPWHIFFDQIPHHFWGTLNVFARDIPNIFIFVATLLFIIGIYGAIKQRNWSVLLILPLLIFGSGIIFLIKHKIPFARTWIYFIPFFLIIADAGFTYLIDKLSTKIQWLLKTIVLGASFFFIISLVSKNAIISYGDTGTFLEAETAARYLKPIASKNDLLYSKSVVTTIVDFYLWYHQVPYKKNIGSWDVKKPFRQKLLNDKQIKEYYIVKKSSYSIKDMTSKPCILLLNLGDLALYQSKDGI